MSVDVEAWAKALGATPLVDPGRLKGGGRREVESAMERWHRDHGLVSYVLILAREESVSDARPLWDRLGLDARRDLLLVANGHAWEARGWGLGQEAADAALARAAPELQRYLGRGLAAAIDALGEAATANPADGGGTPGKPAEGGRAAWPIVGGVVGVLVLGGVGLAIRRRNQRAREAREAFDVACGGAERAFSEVVIAAEELGGDRGVDLQLRAGELKKQLDRIVAGAQGRVAKMDDPVVLGAIRQLEDEFAALRSTGLQRERSAT